MIPWINSHANLSSIEKQYIVNLLCLFRYQVKNLNNKKVFYYLPKSVSFNIILPYIIPNFSFNFH